MAKVEFWWASVGGAPYEPIILKTIDGRRAAFTAGCPDPFYPFEEGCPLRLVEALEDPPLTTRQEAALLGWSRRRYKEDHSHSWRGLTVEEGE